MNCLTEQLLSIELLTLIVSPNKELWTGTVPVNKELLTGTVPVNKELLAGTVPVNNLFQKGNMNTNARAVLLTRFLAKIVINHCKGWHGF